MVKSIRSRSEGGFSAARRSRLRWPLAVLGALALAGCQTPAEPKLKTVTVEVAVSVPCIPKDKDPGGPPAYADEDLPKGSEHTAERIKRVVAANYQRRARLAVLEPIREACR